MVNELLDGICKTVSEEFGLSVYTERVLQNIDEPCFVIRLESSVTELFFGKRYIMKNRFKLSYLDSGRAEHLNSAGILERLCEVLEVLEYDGGLVRGGNMKCSVNENVLEFYISYDMFVYRSGSGEDEPELMQSVKTDMSGI